MGLSRCEFTKRDAAPRRPVPSYSPEPALPRLLPALDTQAKVSMSAELLLLFVLLTRQYPLVACSIASCVATVILKCQPLS